MKLARGDVYEHLRGLRNINILILNSDKNKIQFRFYNGLNEGKQSLTAVSFIQYLKGNYKYSHTLTKLEMLLTEGS